MLHPVLPKLGAWGVKAALRREVAVGASDSTFPPSSDGVFCAFLSNFGAQLLRHYVCCTASVHILSLVRRLLDWSSGVSY